MPESFDPYHKWLGIPPSAQPANYYRLLGVEDYESDADVIENAADMRMMLLRQLQVGTHSDLSQRLLNEIASARICLLDENQKSAYDGQLRNTLPAPKLDAIVRPAPRPKPADNSASATLPGAVPMSAPKLDAEDSASSDTQAIVDGPPIAPQELERLTRPANDNIEESPSKTLFQPGDWVRVKDGFFEDIEGVVETVDANGRISIMNDSYGRLPEVLGHWQVESADLYDTKINRDTKGQYSTKPKPKPRRSPEVLKLQDELISLFKKWGWLFVVVAVVGLILLNVFGWGWLFVAMVAVGLILLLVFGLGGSQQRQQIARDPPDVKAPGGGHQRGGILLRTFGGHTDYVNCVAITPDGRTIVSGSHDETLKVWDLATGRELRTFSGHSSYVKCVAITPDGRTVVSGSGDGTLKVWDMATGRKKRTLSGHTASVNCVAITPDGRTAVSSSDDKTLKIWDLASGRELRTFSGHSDGVKCAAITPDGRTVVSGSHDATLKVWDLANGRDLRTFSGHNGSVRCVAITPDGRTVVSGSHDDTLKVWDLETGEEKRTLSGHTIFVDSVAITPDGRTAVSGSWDSTLKVWDLASGQEKRTFSGHSSFVNCVAITPDGRTAVSGSADETLRVWDLASGE